MKVEITRDGVVETWRIYWRYDITGRGAVRETACFVHRVGVADPFAVGVTKQFVGDRDSKETARKVSLTRALVSAGFARGERGRFWEAYHGRFPRLADTGGPPHDAATATGMCDLEG